MKAHIFPLMGQSNMVGGGGTDPIERKINDRIWYLDLQNKLKVVEHDLYTDPAKSLYGRTVGSSKSYSLGISFADQMIHEYPKDDLIILIPTARGGSSIEAQLHPVGEHTRSLSDICIERVNFIKSISPCSRVEAVLYHQGESDYRRPETWTTEMPKLIEKMKTSLDTTSFIFAQMGDFFVDNLLLEIVFILFKRHQMRFALANNLPMVITEDLDLKDGIVHLSSESLKIVGRRYAEIFKAMQGMHI